MPEQKKKQSLNYQYLFATRKFLMIAIGLGVLSLLLGVLILFPNIQRVQASLSLMSQEEQLLKNLQVKEQTLRNAQSIDLFAKKDQIDAILPSTKPVLQLLQEIERISGENSIIVSEFGVVPGQISTESAEPAQKSSKGAVVGNPNLDSIETKIILLGRIDDINTFLKAINKITPMTETSDLKLKGVNRQDLVTQNKLTDANVFEVTMTLTSYFYVGKVQTNAMQDLPVVQEFTAEETTQLDQFQIPVSALIPPNFTIQGGGKEDLFE